MEGEEGGERKGRQSQDKEEESATDGARLSVCLSGAGQLLSTGPWLEQTSSVYTKEGSQQRDFQVEQMPWGSGEHELTWT